MTRIEGDHVSHRGRGLLLLGLVWITVGGNILTDGKAAGGVVFPLTILDPPIRSALWIASGALAVWFAVKGAGRERTKFAFAFLVVPPSLRALSFAYGWIVYVCTGRGIDDGWLHAIAWGLVVLFVLHEASAPVVVAVLRKDRHIG